MLAAMGKGSGGQKAWKEQGNKGVFSNDHQNEYAFMLGQLLVKGAYHALVASKSHTSWAVWSAAILRRFCFLVYDF
jgi:hypothetical protein